MSDYNISQSKSLFLLRHFSTAYVSAVEKKNTTHLLPKPFCICTVYVIDSKSLWVCFIFMICYNNSKLYFANSFSWSFLYVYTFGRIVWTPPKMNSFIEHLMHR